MLVAGLSQDNQDLMFAHMAMTVLQQSHLCPMPLVVQPVHWAFDHALQLYPLPDAVVLADGSMQASLQHEGCTVFNPVSSRHWFSGFLCATLLVMLHTVPFWLWGTGRALIIGPHACLRVSAQLVCTMLRDRWLISVVACIQPSK